MAERKISTRLQITGEDKYKQSIKDINASLRAYKAELGNLKSKNKEAQNSYDYLRQKGELLNKTQNEQKKKTQELRDALTNAKKAFEDYAKKTDEAANAVINQETKVEELKKTVGESSDEYKEAVKKLEQYKENLKDAESAQELCGRAVTDWKAKLNTAETQQRRTSEEIQKNNQYLKEAENSADKCATSIDKFGRKCKQAADDIDDSNESLEKTGSAMELMANSVIASKATEAFDKVREAINQCIEAATEYQSSIAKLQTISGAESIGQLSADIQELSDATGIAASDLANTAYNAISAGTAVSDAVGMAESASKLAVAGFTDTDSALSVLTTAINAYGDSAGTATEISDSLIQVQNLGVTTVADLAANMGKAIATASAYSVDLANLESAYISTTKAGINTAESTTYISSMFKELGDNGTDVAKTIQEKTGMSFGKLMSSGKSLGDVLKILQDSVDGDSEALMNLWGSAEAGKAANAILNQGVDTFNKNLQICKSSAGATESAYKTMASTSEMAGKRASNAFANLKTAIGNEFLPIIEEVQGGFVDVTERVTEFVKEHPEIVKAIGAIATALGVMAAGIVGVNLVVNVLIPLFQSLNATMAANPIGLAAIAVSGLVTALGFLVATSGEAEGALADYDAAADSAKSATDGLKSSFEEASSTFSDAAGEAKATSDQAGELIDRLEQLSNKSNKTNDDIEEMSNLVTQLNTLYPELGLELNTTTGELSKTNAELERFATNAKNAAMATAYEEELATQSQAVVDAQQALIEARESASKADEEATQLQAEYTAALEKQEKAVNAEQAAYKNYSAVLNDANASVEDMDAAYREYLEAQNDTAIATQELDAFQQQNIDTLNGCEEAQTEANAAIEEAEKNLEDAQEAVDETTEAYNDYQFRLTDVGEACQDTFDKTNEMIDGMDHASESYQNAKADLQSLTEEHLSFQESTQETYDNLQTKLAEVQTAYDEQTASIKSNLESQIGGLDAAELEIEYSAQQIADNLQKQVEYLANYATNAQRIATESGLQLNDTFLAFLNSGSEEAVQVAAAMNQALNEGNLEAAQAVVTNYTNVQTQLDTTSQAAANAVGGYQAQLDQINSDIEACVTSMNREDEAYKNALSTMQGAIRAVNLKKGPYKTLFKTTATEAANSLDKSAETTAIGKNNVQGAINGARSLAYDYVAVYRMMANAAIAEMQRVDQQNSPSKRYKRHGQYNVQGAIQGVKSYSGEYVKAYSDMATEAIDAYNAKMDTLAPMAAEAAESMAGFSGGFDVNVKDGTSELISGIGSTLTASNKNTGNKLDEVLGLLKKYLPESGKTYLDGDLVTKKITNKQTANSRLQNVIVGTR
jgi:TP901 family phage tail tape measure protein